MMQQVATQRSDVAALPVDITPTADAAESAGQKKAFSDIFARTSETDVSPEKPSREKNADDVTDAKSVKPSATAQTNGSGETRHHAEDSAVEDTEKSDSVDILPRHAESDASANTADSQVGHTELCDGSDVAVAQTDWLAFIDAVRNLQTETETRSVIDDTAALSVIDDAAALNTLEDIAPKEIDLEALIAKLSGEQSLSEMSANSELAKEGKVDLKALTEALNEAINKLMASEEQGAEPTTSDEAVSEEVMKIAASLLAALTRTSGRGDNRVAENQAELDGAENPELAADSVLLVALIRAEMGDSGEQQTDDSRQDNTGAQSETSAVKLPVKSKSDLMTLLSTTEAETQQVVADSLADKIVAMLPENTSEHHKQEIRQGVIDKVNQFQSQLHSGTEPEATLESMIATLIGEAGIVPEENIEQRIAGEMRQLSQLVGAATLVANAGNPTVQVASMTQADNTVADIQQLRAERATQQSDADRPVNIHQPDGQTQLAEKVRWMVNARNPMAEIRLDPPELGSMQVRVNVNGDTASVNFVVQSPQARDALAQAEPRLREMLAEQGISLGESVVSQQQGEANEQSKGGSGRGGNGQLAGGAEEESQVIEQSLTRQAQGGIDDYA